MKHQLKTMLDLQDQMNTKVHSDWRGQNYEWYRAIWVECAELLDHYGWKWWKKQEPDVEQVILELVDIWHFGLSDQLMGQGTITNDQLATQIAEAMSGAVTVTDFRQDVEAFAAETLSNKRFDIRLFLPLLQGVGLGFDDLYRQYVGKNVLNFFRQDHGYKTGEYRKLWQGKEDNEHLVEIVNELDADSPDFPEQLYQALEQRYAV